MIGFFIIDSFENPTDSAGFQTRANVSNKMDMNLKGVLYLPPYLRKSQCNISEGDSVFGIIDDVSGLGAAICGIDGADFQYFFDADVSIKKSLSVDDDITASGDVKTGSGLTEISLNNHWHGYIDSKGQPPVATPSQTQKPNEIAPEP